MSEFDKQPSFESTPDQSHVVTPAPGAAAPTGTYQHYAPRPVKSRAWMGVTSLCIGVASFTVVFVALFSAGMGVIIAVTLLGIPASIVAIVFGHLGFNDARRNGTPRGVPIVGIITGYLLLVTLIAMVVVMVLFAAALVNWVVDG